MWNDEESKRILVDRIYYDQWQMLRKSRRDSPSVLRRWGRWKWGWQTPHDDFSHLDIRGRSLIFQQEHEIRLGEGRPQYNCPERSSLCRGHTAWLLAAPLDPLEVRALCSLGGEVATPPLDFFLAVILGSMNNEKMLTFSSASSE